MMFYLKGVVLSLLFLHLPAVADGFESRVDDAHPFGVGFDDTGIDIKNGQGQVEFRFSVPSKHYLYREAFTVELDTTDVTATLELPESERKYDPFQEAEVDIYRSETVVTVLFKLADSFDQARKVAGRISYQGCSDKLCYRFMQQSFSLQILSGQKAPITLGTNSLDRTYFWSPWVRLFQGEYFSQTFKQSLALLVFTCFVGGVLTGFTPCVLPVIPLTLAFMGVSQARGLGERLRRMLPFLLGMVLVNSTLSLISVALGWQVGAIYQSPVFLGGLSLFFLAMALWMLGVFELALPSSFLTRVQRYQPAGWLRSNFYAGATLGILAMPCVGPLQVALLAAIAISQDWLKGVVGMTAYSIGLSAVFFAMSLLSQSVTSRFNRFTVWVKRGIGFLLILGALFYANALSGIMRTDVGKTLPDGFIADLQEAKTRAKKEQKPLLIDFFADWCVPCHEWSKKVFTDPAVKTLLQEKFIAVKINCTTNTPACDAAVQEYGIIGWPSLVFVGADLKEIPDSRLVGYVMRADEFKKYLDSLLAGAGP